MFVLAPPRLKTIVTAKLNLPNSARKQMLATTGEAAASCSNTLTTTSYNVWLKPPNLRGAGAPRYASVRRCPDCTKQPLSTAWHRGITSLATLPYPMDCIPRAICCDFKAFIVPRSAPVTDISLHNSLLPGVRTTLQSCAASSIYVAVLPCSCVDYT